MGDTMTRREGGEAADVAVVGGGLAGLTAALYLARGGRAVTLFEKAHDLGGRAVTEEAGGYYFNRGPHALYRGGEAARALDELGVPYSGRVPGGGAALRAGRAYLFPNGASALLGTRLLGPAAKLELVRFLATVGRLDPAAVADVPLADWLARRFRHEESRQVLTAICRVSTYTNAPERLSAGAFVAQLQTALAGNVLYLDGGWQTLVDGLRRAAADAGVRIVAGARVAAVECGGGAVAGVRLADGGRLAAAAAVLAIAPREAAALVDGSAGADLRRWAAEAAPVRAACLDVALRRLPRSRRRYAVGVDRPLYASVHSAYARLAPAGGAVIHLAQYLADPRDAAGAERELEGLLDWLQPGWRDEAVARRYLPKLVVMNALPDAARGGLAGRPGPAVPGVDGLYVAGDWVGPAGLLADASLGSARRAAALILRTGAAAGAPARAAVAA
ncbi:MAG TPA: NAD(P)/FAD-dependent oxidoreductase [Thermomicrobiales bacterium]|nr:NAD(P)/FAD-dependent oxidoreductase [Thermomicrobiales bacterium]